VNEFELLPTGKPHISFSELKDWKDCSWRHKLKHVDKIDLSTIGPLLDFGTAVHASCENFLKTRIMDQQIAFDIITESYAKNSENEKFKDFKLSNLLLEISSILADVPKWMDETFLNWECVDAEHQLYEKIDNHQHAFKGFVDAVIKCDQVSKTSKVKKIYWVLDWKTTGWGWTFNKKSDDSVKSQIVLYKEFISRKMNIPSKDIKCGFVLLKRAAKPKKHCELFAVPAGDKTIKKSLSVVNNMLITVKRNIAMKNRESCTFCDYKNTQWCT
jgi:hypothetical protein